MLLWFRGRVPFTRFDSHKVGLPLGKRIPLSGYILERRDT